MKDEDHTMKKRCARNETMRSKAFTIFSLLKSGIKRVATIARTGIDMNLKMKTRKLVVKREVSMVEWRKSRKGSEKEEVK